MHTQKPSGWGGWIRERPILFMLSCPITDIRVTGCEPESGLRKQRCDVSGKPFRVLLNGEHTPIQLDCGKSILLVKIFFKKRLSFVKLLLGSWPILAFFRKRGYKQYSQIRQSLGFEGFIRVSLRDKPHLKSWELH